MRIRNPGWEKFGSGIRDGKKSEPGSPINTPDPQRCLFMLMLHKLYGRWVEISTSAAQPRGEQAWGDRGARGSSTQRQGTGCMSLLFCFLTVFRVRYFLGTKYPIFGSVIKHFFYGEFGSIMILWAIRNTSSVVKLFRILTSVKLSLLSVSRIFKVDRCSFFGIGPHSSRYLKFLFYQGVRVFFSSVI